MKIPYTWLKEYVDTDLPPQELADKLTMAGLEVDRVEPRWQKVVTAKITFLEKVEGSDHLNATRVTTGDGTERSVVCGAPNISLGDVVPLALPGAIVQAEGGETFTIGVTKKRGVLSEGMLCSPRELGLSNEHYGIYLLPPETPLGQPFDETVIELDIKAHRGDLFSVTGVAREVAAFNRTHMRLPEIKVPEKGKKKVQDLAKLTVEDTELCPRFTARVISNVKIGPSPLWMVKRLASAGMRSISNVVDITNYVMLEIGQPLHAFDYDHIADHHMIVRRAKPSETLKTLDGQQRALTPDMIMNCDPSGPLSVGGVMGGETSEISDGTTTVFLEAANWHAGNIRRTSARLGLRSEASSRFEKGLDPELARLGLDRATQLIVELAGGIVAPGILDNYPKPVEPRILRLHPDNVEWLLGYPVTASETASALEALEFGVEIDDEGEGMTVTVPTWRGDVKEAADLVEEVARVLGYDRITGTIPSGPLPEPQRESWFAREESVRDIMAGAGYREIVTYPLTSRAAMLQILSDQSNVSPLLIGAAPMQPVIAEPATTRKGKKGKPEPVIAEPASALPMVPPEQMPTITLANPLSAKQEVLRLTLLVSLLETLSENVRQGAQTVRFFEVGRRYVPTPEMAEGTGLPHERPSLGVILSGVAGDVWLSDSRTLDFFDAKAAAEALFQALHIKGARYTPTHHPTFHPGRCALIELPISSERGAPVRPAGIIGEIHPEVAKRYSLPQRAYALEIDLERIFAIAPENVRYSPISRFPALTRDIAVVASKDVPASDLAAAIRDASRALVRSVTLFDVYEGSSISESQRSLAFTVVYQADDRTLSDAEGDDERAKVVKLLRERFGATIRE